MQTRDEVIVSARVIKNYLSMGTPIGETLRDLADIQPKYRSQWRSIANRCETGSTLASQIRDFGLWPESMVAAITAGEESNSLESILDSIVTFNLRMKAIMSVISTKILTPAIFLLAGITIFIGFMIFVLPGIAKPLKNPRDRKGLIALSDNFVYLYEHHLVTVCCVAAAALVGIIYFFKSQPVRDALFSLINKVPLVGPGLREIYFGFWLQFMAILDAAGDITYSEMVRISSSIIPNIYRPGMVLIVKEASTGGGLPYAVNDKRWSAEDPRQIWPKMFKGVMRQSASLGKIKEAFEQASAPLIEEGTIKVNQALALFNLLAMAAAAGGIVTPMVGMMLVQLDVVNKMK